MSKKVIFAVLCLSLFSCLYAETYFVSVNGSDSSSGLKEEEAFKTINYAVKKVKPGDMVTVLPGIFRETIQINTGGDDAKAVIIKAKFKDKTVLDGGICLKEFKKISNRKEVYEYNFPSELPLELKETDTNIYYSPQIGIYEVEKNLSSFFYDKDTNKLYIHTSDAKDPEYHTLQAFFHDYGIKITGVNNVTIDGFVLKAYSQRGIFLYNTNNCTVKNCRIYDCGSGIIGINAKNTLLEDNKLYYNGLNKPFGDDSAHISFSKDNANTTVRRCTALYGGHHGIRFYGSMPPQKLVFENNLLDGNRLGGIWFKSGSAIPNTVAKSNICIGLDDPTSSSTILLNGAEKYFNTKICTNNTEYPEAKIRQVCLAGTGDLFIKPKTLNEAKFVDPYYYDYRLQSDSPYRKKVEGKDAGAFQYNNDVFFVKQDGSDENDGTCIVKAWKTIAHACKNARAGDTVYIMEGTYNESIIPEKSGQSGKPIIFRARKYKEADNPFTGDGKGREMFKINGEKTKVGVKGIVINNLSNMEFEGFEVSDLPQSGCMINNSADIKVKKCVFAKNRANGLEINGGSNIEIDRNTFWNNNGWQIFVSGSAKNIDVRSNLICINSSSKGMVNISSETVVSASFDYNCYYPAKGILNCRFQTGNFIYDELSLWQRKTGTDLNSFICNDPLLVNPVSGDYRPEFGSPLIRRGEFSLGIGVGDDLNFVPKEKVKEVCFIEDIRVNCLSSTTATVTWWTPQILSASSVYWGDTPALENKIDIKHDNSIFHHIPITGLKPGTNYYFRVESYAPYHEYHSNKELTEQDLKKEREFFSAPVMMFTTFKKASSPRTFYVSPTGNNNANGLSKKTAWKTLGKASNNAEPGDTVIFMEGVYYDKLEPLSSGTKDMPVTFKVEKPGTVIFRGDSSAKEAACVRLVGTDYIIFDGIIFQVGTSIAPQVKLLNASDVTFKRCHFDAYSWGYILNLTAIDCGNLTFEDSIICNSQGYPMYISNSSSMILTFKNCNIGIDALPMCFPKCKKIIIRNCIISSISKQKCVIFPILALTDVSCMDSDYNMFWFMPYDKDHFIGAMHPANNFWLIHYEKEKSTRWYGLEQWQKTGNDLHSFSVVDVKLNRYNPSPFNPVFTYQDFIPAMDSLGLGKGENGTDIGIRPYGELKRNDHGVNTMEKK
ncbi:MAG: hypothetical protein A2017_13765 [Lentisphaerae bacterium GWF2_44_16]|nr:MAG: hypothetical protein A2017_13765 [Lentisphaerae bacterium GWF2_44_16]